MDSEDLCVFCFAIPSSCWEDYNVIYYFGTVFCFKSVNSWLNLHRNCTPGTVFHPGVLNLPFLPHLKQSAKLSYILAVERSVDPLIVELRHSVLATTLLLSSTLSAAKASVTNIHSATFKNHICTLYFRIQASSL